MPYRLDSREGQGRHVPPRSSLSAVLAGKANSCSHEREIPCLPLALAHSRVPYTPAESDTAGPHRAWAVAQERLGGNSRSASRGNGSGDFIIAMHKGITWTIIVLCTFGSRENERTELERGLGKELRQHVYLEEAPGSQGRRGAQGHRETRLLPIRPDGGPFV